MTKAYKEDEQRRILQVKALAAAGFAAQLATLWLICTRQQTYLRLRRLILQIHWLMILLMVDRSLPLLAATKMTHEGQLSRLMSFLFRNASFINITLAAMHRLPWQVVVTISALYSCWGVLFWAKPYCSTILADPAMKVAVRQLTTSLATVLDYLTGHGDMVQHGDNVFWQAHAHTIAAACGTAASSIPGDASSSKSSSESHANRQSMFSPSVSNTCPAGGLAAEQSLPPAAAPGLSAACAHLVLGQCQAVSRTISVWLGMLTVATLVLLSERVNKWTFVHRRAPWLLEVQGLPAAYQQKSMWVFVRMQLLQLHVLLDVPLLLLWVGFCAWSRPDAAVQELPAAGNTST